MRVLFPDDFDERAQEEMTVRGYLSHARVEADDGRIFPVFFADPVRLAQELADLQSLNQPFLAEVGLVVLPEVTVAAIQDAVARLGERGFFGFFRPLTPEDRPWEL